LRIASLVPSATDIACALGLEAELVGVSHECDHPAARGKPVLTASNIPHGLAPAEIDARVSQAMAAGESLYRVERERLAELRPDVVLSQAVCDVCAVGGRELEGGVPPGARLVMLGATDVASLAEDLRRVGAATGAAERAEAIVSDMMERLERVRALVAGRPRPRVLALEWGDPPFIGGHWVPELIAAAGGEHVLGPPGVPSVRVSWEAIRAAQPELVVFLPCGYGVGAAEAEARELVRRGELGALEAVRAGRLWATDASALFSRATPVMARAAEVLAGILHPEVAAPPRAEEAVRIAAP
jgi:iron complex transport system substrate-binding protein